MQQNNFTVNKVSSTCSCLITSDKSMSNCFEVDYQTKFELDFKFAKAVGGRSPMK